MARTLVEFDTTTITSARTAGTIPASGSVDFFLRMYDAEHVESTPRDFTLTVAAISQSWNEGTGLDMNNYTDLGESNWLKANSTTSWTHQGGDFLTGSSTTPPMHTSKAFDKGTEDLLVDVTTIVEEWLIGNTGSYGFGVFLTSSQETAVESYYTKKFFARQSEFFHRRPTLEARFSDVVADDSSNFFLSSSRAPAADNLNTIFMYNYIRGQLVDVPGIGAGAISVSLYSGSTAPIGSPLALPAGGDVSTGASTSALGGRVETGIYSASLAFNSSSITSVYPVWHNGSGTEFFTGSAISVKPLDICETKRLESKFLHSGTKSS